MPACAHYLSRGGPAAALASRCIVRRKIDPSRRRLSAERLASFLRRVAPRLDLPEEVLPGHVLELGELDAHDVAAVEGVLLSPRDVAVDQDRAGQVSQAGDHELRVGL